ncbi:hypothetical protein GCM10007108_13220 [Thermogymnomonas acidicola]|uniref:Uncharacterized protein n=1 Tax=Thermogymnomonas acidicola TaxID=399579 RepID=A0AA37BS07_9ARCH|nr:hypothetical protein GCM10007108_13220 [Thermogymnomonas acidicola]
MSDFGSQKVVQRVRDWAHSNYGVPENGVNIYYLKRLGNGTWRARCSFIYNNEEKKFTLTIGSDGEITSYSDLSRSGPSEMGAAPTMVLIAEVFAILALIGFTLGAIVLLVSYATSVSVAGAGLSFISPAIFIFPGLLIILAVISGYIVSRTLKIRSYIEQGDAVAALQIDSVGLGVLALLFSGVISGILLLLAREDLRRASQ